MRMILLHTENELAEKIRDVTNSHWNHIGVLVNNKCFLDFSHDEKKLTRIDSLVDEHLIIDDGRYNYEVFRDVNANYAVAKYDLRNIIKLHDKIVASGRDHDNIQSGENHFTCSNLIAHAYVHNLPLKHKVYHWSQATPEDFYRMFK
jgi:hypothetical protein